MNSSTLRIFFTVLFSLLGPLAFGAATYSETYTSYATRDDSFKYGYLYQQAVLISTGGITGKTVRVGPLTNPASPAIFQTGWLNLNGNNTISFDHKVNGQSSTPVLTVSLVDLTGASIALPNGNFTYSNSTVRNSIISLGALRMGWFKVRFAFAGTGGNTNAFLDNITSNITAATATTSSTKLSDLSITSYIDKGAYTIGQTAVMTINVANAGPDVAEGGKMLLNVPAAMSVQEVTFNSVAGTYDAASKTVTFSNINNGSSGTVTVVAKAINAGIFNLGAALTGFPVMTDQNTSNNTTTNEAKINEAVLPVEFSHLVANHGTEGVKLTWKTAMEKDAAVFNILYSNNGIDFTHIGTVNAVGNSTTEQVYNFIHTNKSSTKGYYQIIEVDIDGSKTASPKVSINAPTTTNINVSAYPNSTVDFLTIDLDQESTSIQLFNAAGVTQTISISSLGINTYSADLSHLPIGTYYLWAQGAKAIKIVKA